MIESIITNFQGIGLFIIFLGILITVHEWGHFITAKKLGVNVEEFSLGFGPTLFSRMYNGTNYLIKALPLGGYVKMAGDERSRCKGAPDEFYSKSVGYRSLIILNGPMVNFVLAYICLIFVFMFGYLNPEPRVVGLKHDSPAVAAGLKLGDVITAIDDEKIYYWKDIKAHIQNSKAQELKITVLRENTAITKVVPVKEANERNMFGRYEQMRTIGLDENSNVIGWIKEGDPANLAGIEIGDQIIEINRQPINGWKDIQENITSSRSESINIKLLREDKVIKLKVVPKMADRKGKDGQAIQVPVIGIGPQPQELKSYRFGVIDSITRASKEYWEITSMTYEAIYAMIVGTMSAKDSVGGPVLIYSIVADSATRGVSYFLFILGVISLNLAIFNLLPVIPLDGGHLFLNLIEKLRGEALPAKVDEYVARFGFTLIILLALYVFYIDFERIGLIAKIKSFFS